MISYRKNRQARRTSRHPGSRHRNRSSSAILWLSIGLFSGILGATAVQLFITNKLSTHNSKVTLSTAMATKSNTEKLATPAKPQPALVQVKDPVPKKEPPQRFEFYQLLPGMEVPIPDTDNPSSAHTLAAIPKRASAASSTATTVTSSHVTATPKITIQKAQRETKNQVSVKKLAKTQTKLAAAQYLIQAGSYRTLSSAENLKSRLTVQGFVPRIQKIEAEDGIWYRVTLGPFPSETMALNQKNRLAKQKIQGILILQRR